MWINLVSTKTGLSTVHDFNTVFNIHIVAILEERTRVKKQSRYSEMLADMKGMLLNRIVL
jgi:hypothetical protein